MTCGRVYSWVSDAAHPLGGRVRLSTVPLLRLDPLGEGLSGLCGRYVLVRNGGAVSAPNSANGAPEAVPIGDAFPNAQGDFLFEPGRGGGRMDKVAFAERDFQLRYIQAAHFGEVNTYFHLDNIAHYVDGLLSELGAKPLPRVIAVVNAHHAATEQDGIRDGIRRGDEWVAFQGGHYRLSDRCRDVPEHRPVSPDGEIHLGPGRQLLHHGALVEAAGGRYRANASHNAGILYHEYSHHITRHTADFRVNARRKPHRQNNRKTAMDEGTCDYWAATMLGTPHIWAWHHRHDEVQTHRRSLTSAKTMTDFDSSPGADPHANGTIWAAALWDLRARLVHRHAEGVRRTDLMVLKALLLMGTIDGEEQPPTVKTTSRARESFAVGLAALLEADAVLYTNQHRPLILETFAKRGIDPTQHCSVRHP